VTDPLPWLHSRTMVAVGSLPVIDGDGSTAVPRVEAPAFETVYDTYFPYVWRSVQRLGVPASQVDDVVQEIFLVAYRRLGDFEARSSLKTWLYGIALRVARVHRARYRRTAGQASWDIDQLRAPDRTHPDEQAANAEAVLIVHAILEDLDDDQREVFVLAELEQFSAPEIARALDVNLNTVYSRLRLARAVFAEGAARQRARDRWRTA
jgi:RNA polymerase sigma-70 factor (ECF subfamily)